MCVCVHAPHLPLYRSKLLGPPRTFLGTGKSYRNFKSQAQFQFDTALSQESDFTFTFHFHTLEKEMATHSSVLAWRIPGMVEPGGLPSVAQSRTRLKRLSSSSSISGKNFQGDLPVSLLPFLQLRPAKHYLQ